MLEFLMKVGERVLNGFGFGLGMGMAFKLIPTDKSNKCEKNTITTFK